MKKNLASLALMLVGAAHEAYSSGGQELPQSSPKMGYLNRSEVQGAPMAGYTPEIALEELTFIRKEELATILKATAQGLPSYALKLALKTLTPPSEQLMNLMNHIRTLLQKSSASIILTDYAPCSEEMQLRDKIGELSRTHSLLFVFKKGCPHCEEFAPVVREFAQKFGFGLEGVTAGEEVYEGMKCRRSMEVVSTLNPEGIYPLLFLVNRETGDAIALSRGFVGRYELLRNAGAVVKYLGDPS